MLLMVHQKLKNYTQNRQSAYNNIHSSEIALDNYEDFDYTIDNNNCIDCLIESVKEILKHEKII